MLVVRIPVSEPKPLYDILRYNMVLDINTYQSTVLDPKWSFKKIFIYKCTFEPHHFAYVKTKMQISFAVTAKLISVFVFATRI